MRYRFMDKHSETLPVTKMAKVLGIHRSRYYRWMQTSEKRILKAQKENALIDRTDKRSPRTGLIFHSDRGSQDCSKRFRKALNSVLENQSNTSINSKIKNTKELKHNPKIGG